MNNYALVRQLRAFITHLLLADNLHASDLAQIGYQIINNPSACSLPFHGL